MAHARTGPQRRLVEIVEGGQTTREEFAIHDTLGKAIERAEAQTQRQLFQPLRHQLLVARPEHRQTVAHHDPVGGGAVELATLLAGFANHRGVVALSGAGIGLRIDGAEYIEVEKAVIDRRHQRVGHRVRETHQIAVGAGRIDDDEVERTLNGTHSRRELREFRRLVLGHHHAGAEFDTAVMRQFEIEAGAARPGSTVGDVAAETLLPAVQIDGGDTLACLQQGDGDMQAGRGLARPALLVAEHDDMRRAGLSLSSLQQHPEVPSHYLQIASGWGQAKCDAGRHSS